VIDNNINKQTKTKVMAFAPINNNPFALRKQRVAARKFMNRRRRKRADGLDILTPVKSDVFGYAPIKSAYSSDVLPYNEYGYTPNLPAPPENCFYVFDAQGNASLKCSDAPVDVYVSSPVVTEPLPSEYASFQFPNWNTLTCEEIMKYISAIEQEMTYIRVTPDILAIYNKQLEYARLLLSEKCKKPVDLELGLGDTGGIKTPVEVPVDIAETPIDAELGTGTTDVIPSPTLTTNAPLPPVSGSEPVGKAPFKFQWWWAVAAGVGLYLITKSNK